MSQICEFALSEVIMDTSYYFGSQHKKEAVIFEALSQVIFVIGRLNGGFLYLISSL